jgi:hypothetical protein
LNYLVSNGYTTISVIIQKRISLNNHVFILSGENMVVYCRHCGVENPDVAEICQNCGEPLKSESYPSYRRRSRMGAFFGFGGSSIWGIILGLFILLIGVISLLGNYITWITWDNLWPIFVIGIGLLIILNALRR